MVDSLAATSISQLTYLALLAYPTIAMSLGPMEHEGYIYTFPTKSGSKEISFNEIRKVIVLSLEASTGIHGSAQVRMDSDVYFNEKSRAFWVSSRTPTSQTVAKIATALLVHFFGVDSFSVKRYTANLEMKDFGMITGEWYPALL